MGVPFYLIMDGHIAQKNNNINKFCHQIETTIHTLEAGTPWDNHSELYIGLFKEDVRRNLHTTNVSMVLWDYCMERQSKIHSAVPHQLFQNQEMTPHESTFGEHGDISNICNFGWYQWVYYRNPNSFTATK